MLLAYLSVRAGVPSGDLTGLDILLSAPSFETQRTQGQTANASGKWQRLGLSPSFRKLNVWKNEANKEIRAIAIFR